MDLNNNTVGGTVANNGLSDSQNLAQLVPEEYLYDPFNAEPTLDNLRQAAQDMESHSDGDGELEDILEGTSVIGNGGEANAGQYSGGNQMKDGSMVGHSSLSKLLQAADRDVAIHVARIKAVLAQDPSLLETYSPESDSLLHQRAQRLSTLIKHKDELQSHASEIISSLNENNLLVDVGSKDGTAAATQKDNITQANLLQARLEAWEKALQFYVYCPPVTSDDKINTGTTASTTKSNISIQNNSNKPTLSLLQLLQHLTLIAKDEPPPTSTTLNQDESALTKTLEQAVQMCNKHLGQVSTLLSDSVDHSSETYQFYHVHLMAHSIGANRTLERTERIHDKFLLHGKEALKVGHALEMAEAKRRQSEYASVLIRRFWMMEKLAEQEEFSGEQIRVEEEVRGVIPSSACKMDPLFTKTENSLVASRILKNLRMVIKCRSNTGGSKNDSVSNKSNEEGDNDDEHEKEGLGNVQPPSQNTATTPTNSGGMLDPQAIKRFERTNDLVQRTSNALEKRLLNTFSKIYTNGGTYDFTSLKASKRKGRLDWLMLREVSKSLMNFDSGRSLHQRYIDLVVTTKFPELFQNIDDNGSSYSDGSDTDDRETDGTDIKRLSSEEQQEFDMDATRSKLSTLFHRVCEVCMEEFQLIAHVFSPKLLPHLLDGSNNASSTSSWSHASFSESYPLHVARALLQRVISGNNGMQAQINNLLESIDKRGDFDAGAKKLDTFVVIHEKAAGLFDLLKEAAQKMWSGGTIGGTASNRHRNVESSSSPPSESISNHANAQAVSSLIQFLTSQEMALSSGQRRGYLNLELRLLHHECCANLDRVGSKFLKPIQAKQDKTRSRNMLGAGDGGTSSSITVGSGITLVEYRAPIMPLDKEHISKGGYTNLLNGPLKQSVLRQPLIHATDSLARARLMFGLGQGGGEDIDSTARVIVAIFSQMCNFYGSIYLYPIVESLGKMLARAPPSAPPVLPFDENVKPHDLGVDGNFWLSIERIHSSAKSFDRELWAENRTGSVRVWEILVQTRSMTSLTVAKDRRIRFFQELEERGEAVILRALDTLSTHIQWILVTGGENMNTGGNTKRLLGNFTSQNVGPYAVPTGSLLDSPHSPAVKALTFCLRAQFVHIQAALTPQSLSAFWTALSMRLYDILVSRLIQHYYVSTVGAVILSRDVEALRTVAMLAGTEHSHWDNLRELLTLYMTPPDALKSMLVGSDGNANSGKGMFGLVGRDQSLVFMSRRVDYRYRTNQGLKKSQWVTELLYDLCVKDPTDGRVNMGLYSAERMQREK